MTAPERVTVGTAGHIDHGKTRLVEALTGTDCDRFAEEKERGITIDLGFAHLERDGLELGFVDVPGHERFLHNALAGLGGIRVMLLVVAADEGVKPQTREHLDICSLLAIPAAIVALTKSDLASADLVELARLEVEELLAETRFAGAPIVPVSSLTGDGVPELETALVELARRHAAPPDDTRPARLPIDRAFHLKGLGVVVTGTLASGSVAPGDALEALPGGARARVRNVQVHGESRERAAAGERTALQLSGVELADVARGTQLVTPGAYAPTSLVVARCALVASAAKPIKGSTAVRFHLLSSEVHGKLRPLDGALEPGGEGTVEIRLARPVTVVRGDRYIVRRLSPAETLGGGTILDPAWRRHRGSELEAAVAGLQGDDDAALALWAAEAGEGGIEAEPVGWRLGVETRVAVERLAALAADGALLETPAGQGHGARWLEPAALDRVRRRAREVLEVFFRRQRLAEGMPKAEAVKRILPGRAAELTDVYLRWLAKAGDLELAGDKVTLPGRSAALTGQESKLSAQLVEHYEAAGLEPPAPAEAARSLGAKPQIVEGVVKYLLERGRLLRLPGGLIISATAVERVAAELGASDMERFTVPEFKSRFGLTRKWAIPLLEQLDSTGVTRRLGDERMIVRRG